MKGAIANIELFAFERPNGPNAKARRLSLVIAAPERQAAGAGWHCRVALADLHRPEAVTGRDSFEALARAIVRARDWIDDLQADGLEVYCDRDAQRRFELP